MNVNEIIENNEYSNNKDIDYNIKNDLNKIFNINDNKIDTLVLSGGGARGFSYSGVFKALEDLNILKDINIFVGTSMGSIACFFLIIGYTPDEIKEFCLYFDFNKIFSDYDKNIIFDYGLNDGEIFCNLLESLLENKNLKKNISFKELYELKKKKLIVNGVCLNNNNIYYFDPESYPDMSIVKAIRISISVPLIFTPVRHDNLLFVDGGLINNFPIDLFNSKLESVFGIITSFDNDELNIINNLEEYLQCFNKCYSRGSIETIYTAYEKYVLLLNLNIELTEIFKKHDKEKFKTLFNNLYQEGYKKTIEYFNEKRPEILKDNNI